MAVDLHTHSTASDGSVTPADLMFEAAAARLEVIALTDHDTLDGLVPARPAAERAGVRLIGGIELSLEWEPGTMHLVVLFIEPGGGPLQDRLTDLQDARHRRNQTMLERLGAVGVEIRPEELAEEASGGSVGRPHMAAVLVRKGYVETIQEAFERYLAKGTPGYADRPRLTPEEGIGLARASGGVPILSHAHTLGVDNRFQFADLMDRLTAAGLIGIETHYGAYDADGRRSMETIARRFGLSPSGGSDYHGTYKPDVKLGSGKFALPIPSDILEELESRR